ncbi:Fe2+-dependent dioxygenase [Dongia deserti]|uniref:Fe2+-dependent dioxygenase n=1 Tax=Dongia deserti TaxID=2268030 RepID=UPI000E64882D|nr:Fe2+-dependent dioxygenase [Dongia deserti]
MIVCIPDVLTADEIKKLRAEAALLPFVPGLETAGGRARRVKNNEQVSQKAEERKPLHEIVVGALMRSKEFQRAALPKRVRPPLISRYREGMAYGKHVDNALMGPKMGRERSDVSVTVFISDIDEYDGGELVIHSAFGVQEVKLPSGSAVAYPSSSLHEVAAVTRGERLVAVTWAQSYVRDESQREILAHLAQVKDKMNDAMPDAEETDLVHHAYTNLLRMWAET